MGYVGCASAVRRKRAACRRAGACRLWACSSDATLADAPTGKGWRLPGGGRGQGTLVGGPSPCRWGNRFAGGEAAATTDLHAPCGGAGAPGGPIRSAPGHLWALSPLTARRTLKSYLKVRPLYHYRRWRVRADVLISAANCYTPDGTQRWC